MLFKVISVSQPPLDDAEQAVSSLNSIFEEARFILLLETVIKHLPNQDLRTLLKLNQNCYRICSRRLRVNLRALLNPYSPNSNLESLYLLNALPPSLSIVSQKHYAGITRKVLDVLFIDPSDLHSKTFLLAVAVALTHNISSARTGLHKLLSAFDQKYRNDWLTILGYCEPPFREKILQEFSTGAVELRPETRGREFVIKIDGEEIKLFGDSTATRKNVGIIKEERLYIGVMHTRPVPENLFLRYMAGRFNDQRQLVFGRKEWHPELVNNFQCSLEGKFYPDKGFLEEGEVRFVPHQKNYFRIKMLGHYCYDCSAPMSGQIWYVPNAMNRYTKAFIGDFDMNSILRYGDVLLHPHHTNSYLMKLSGVYSDKGRLEHGYFWRKTTP